VSKTTFKGHPQDLIPDQKNDVYNYTPEKNHYYEGVILQDPRERPHVLMMSEITVDGKLTLKKGSSSKILMKYMDPATEILLHETRARYDAIMVGSNTIRIDNSYLTVRYVKGKSPLRVIPCSRADIALDANVLGSDAPTLIVVSEDAPEERVRKIREKGVHVARVGKHQVDLPLLMQFVWEDFGVRSLMIEGGPTLNWHMLHHHLVDEIRLIHLPFIVGGSDTPSLVGGMHIESEEEMIRLSLKTHYMAGTNLVTEYDVLYPGT
jgi:2,5-diamino-6-(ribosylamino)-4(3H)-pyrimidinone 5'-phosphate reductase